MTHHGTLYIVATPIGNLGDMSARAIKVLQAVAMIFAEDTRHSAKLMDAFDIKTKTRSFHEHNEGQVMGAIMELMSNGQDVALISDAGTPLISDPGFKLVKAVRNAGMTVSPVPGPCALTAALSAAGLPTNAFIFEGFLPVKQAGRLKALGLLKYERRTLIFYESPHRLLASIEDMSTVFGGERQLVIAHEITKLYEALVSGTFEEVLQQLIAEPNLQKGESVVLVAGCDASDALREDALSEDVLLDELLAVLPLKQAVKITAKVTGQSKNAIYERALAKRG